MSAEMHAMVGAYALDALDHIEQVAFESHLASCPMCADELVGFHETAERLGSAVAVAPPPRLRTAVLDEVSRTTQERRVIPLQRRDRWRRRMPMLVAAASALAVVSLFGVYLAEHDRFADEQNQQEQQAAVLAANDASTTSERLGGGTRVKVIASDSLDRAVVVMHGVPPLKSGTSYQMWAVGSAGVQSLGVMGGEDLTEPTTRLVKGIKNADSVALTVEPEGGSERPTSKPVISVDLV